MGKLERHATIADVAALAGVSVGTASKALNGRGSLREETRKRVRDAARQLSFEANAGARSLHSGRTYTVGMITTDTIGRFSIPVLMGAEDALGAGEMSVFLCDGRGDPIREQYYVKTLLSRRVDGIIVTGRRTEARPPIGVGLPVPVVYAFIASADPADCSVVPDEAGGARKAIDHLLAIGRTRIAHVTGPEHHNSAQVRAAAAVERLAEEGLSLAMPPLFGGWSEMWGRQAVGLLLAGQAEFDAVFCGSDQIARGVCDALRAAGRRVPEDVALVGFDNWDVMTEGAQPPLTSIDMNLEGLGRSAAEKLLAAINGAPSPGRHAMPCHLVVRESTTVPFPPLAPAG
ncbi:LacI family transcriptional regulator [Sphaerisporangium melleum]|uniref:LacI family transcriptional regulator n=1 Tax=Sphaerisporangium melleum TaxID=321316 RepID=A0A917RRH2_9ACTN|nr:LacI family DNA-binding transcriptional regulator [Sphaerisporangium melleum]GGL21385.1 LacI family transcriptional regulator [Sphaerisporangium melleum]GII74994.1 LacI family transcriptional regulator [Sphaerisporangium melleum]